MTHKIEMMALSDLEQRKHPRNPKAHAIDQLIQSLERFGMAAPVLLCERTGLIAAGHGRTEAIASIAAGGGLPPAGIVVDGDQWEVPVVRGWSSKDDVDAMRAEGAVLKEWKAAGSKGERPATPVTDARDAELKAKEAKRTEPATTKKAATAKPPVNRKMVTPITKTSQTRGRRSQVAKAS
jgi:hypothetical protein